MQTFVLILLFFLSAAAPLNAQTPDPSRALPAPDVKELDRMKQEVFSSKTETGNFEKRAEFARTWIMVLVTRGKAEEVQRIAPPGTIPGLRQKAAASPTSAYGELDNLFRELDRIEKRVQSPLPVPKTTGTKTGVASRDLSVINPASGANLWAKLYYPSQPAVSGKYPAVIYITGALGYGSDPLVGRAAEIIAAGGFAVGIFDPDGRGKSGGKEDWNGPVQQEGLHAFIQAVSGQDIVDRRNMGLVSLSYGIALAAGALGRHPDDSGIQYLIDVEGPSDRFSITLNDSPAALAVFNNHRTTETEWWREREPLRWVARIKAAYLRVQNERDHTQSQNKHAVDLINAATNTAYGGQGQSAWTRVNGAENGANRTYSETDAPQWLPGKGMPTPEVTLQYIKEMAGKASF